MQTRMVKVADVARSSLHMINGLASVRDAIEEMNRLKVSSLVIERRHDGDEFGVVTVRDIAEKVVAQNRSVERTSVYEIMNKPFLTIGAEMNVKYAIRLLSQLGLARALVANQDQPLGFVSLRDLVLSYVETEEPEG